jgi:hypothetical protein
MSRACQSLGMVQAWCYTTARPTLHHITICQKLLIVGSFTMYLLQSMILVRARMEEISRPSEPWAGHKSPARSRGALRIKLDARQARRESPVG